jgi:hypothetical protein
VSQASNKSDPSSRWTEDETAQLRDAIVVQKVEVWSIINGNFRYAVKNFDNLIPRRTRLAVRNKIDIILNNVSNGLEVEEKEKEIAEEAEQQRKVLEQKQLAVEQENQVRLIHVTPTVYTYQDTTKVFIYTAKYFVM